MKKITIIGLGYVGLPLAVEFAKKTQVVGFDINPSRVDELNTGHNSTLEVEDENLKSILATQPPDPLKGGSPRTSSQLLNFVTVRRNLSEGGYL